MIKNSLRVYPSNNGDSFLLNFYGFNFLIDGGYVNTYKSFIRNDLLELTKLKEKLDYLIVTHIDQDHISGINKLIEVNNQSPFIEIDNIWHNSLKHLYPRRRKEEAFTYPLIESIASQSYLQERIEGEKNIGAIQGSTLARLIIEGNYKWNTQFDNKAISTNNNSVIQISKDVKLILLSPDDNKISKLNKYWQRELIKHGYLNEVSEHKAFDDAFEVMVSKQKCKKRVKSKDISDSINRIDSLLSLEFLEDDSASNGSSIAFILEGYDKRLLFLGDSHPSLICHSLKSFYPTNMFPLKFDLVKLSHHGSFANNSPDFFSLINSNHYIFSTNGKGHNHPDDETIANIIVKKNENLVLHFNYNTQASNFFNNHILKEEYKYKTNIGSGEEPLDIEF